MAKLPAWTIGPSALALVLACATACSTQPKTQSNTIQTFAPTEGAIGNPSVPVIGLAGIPATERDRIATVAKEYLEKRHLPWANQAVYEVARSGSGWVIRAWEITGHDTVGRPIFKQTDYVQLLINYRLAIVDFYDASHPLGDNRP